MIVEPVKKSRARIVLGVALVASIGIGGVIGVATGSSRLPRVNGQATVPPSTIRSCLGDDSYICPEPHSDDPNVVDANYQTPE
jgi:hypothetical protein